MFTFILIFFAYFFIFSWSLAGAILYDTPQTRWKQQISRVIFAASMFVPIGYGLHKEYEKKKFLEANCKVVGETYQGGAHKGTVYDCGDKLG